MKIISCMIAVMLICITCINLSGCKKDAVIPIQIGQKYHLRTDVFNKGAYQPVQPVLVDSLYIDPATGLPYAKCTAQIDWNNFALSAGNGVKQQTVNANLLLVQSFKDHGIQLGDQSFIKWFIPQADLK